MKTKFKLSNRILSLVMAFVMVLGMMPMTAYAAADTSAYAPVRYENLANSDSYDYSIFANGTAITIEAAPNGTRVWYMDGTTKKYVTNNGENGEDLSGWNIYVGSTNADGMRGVNGSITMTGGTVGYIFAGQYYGHFTGTSNITITGGTVKNSIFCNCSGGSSGVDQVGTVTIYDVTGAAIETGYGKADNVVQKKGTTWKVSGNGIIPTGVTLTVNEGETLTVPSGATLRNNGSLVNNGGTIAVYGRLLGNAPENYVAPSEIIFSPSTLNANVSTTLTTPTASPDNTTLVPWFTYEIADAGTTGAVINGATITPYGGGTVKVKVLMHDGYCTPIEKVYDFSVSFTAVTGISGNVPTECWINVDNVLPTAVTPSDASHQTVVWSVANAGTAGAVVNDNKLNATNSGTATIRATVANGKGYGMDFVQDFTVTFKATDNIDIGVDSVVISKKDDSTLTVTYAGFVSGSKDYSLTEPIYITGTTNSNTVSVESGVVANIVIDDLNISLIDIDTEYSPFYIMDGAKVTMTLLGDNYLKIDSKYCLAALRVPGGAALTIDGNGNLKVQAGDEATAIGGNSSANAESAGTITILGGTVTAEGGSAGIGGGQGRYTTGTGGNGGIVTISGGFVTAIGGIGAGIGGGGTAYGMAGSGGTVKITGGTVTATSSYGAGIGGGGVLGTYKIYTGTAGSGGVVEITGGTVTAGSTNQYGGAGIGSGGTRYGTGNAGGTVIITGGNVKVSSTGGEAIGKGYNGTGSGTLTDGNDNSVSKVTITLNEAAADTAVTAIAGMTYGINDVKTLDTNKLYFYLPSGVATTSVTAGGVVYDCKAGLTYYPGHEYKDATCIEPQTCQHCGHTVGEALGHSYVDGVCTVCGIGEDGVYQIYTADQLMAFAALVNAGTKDADAVLLADIDLTGYDWTPIGVTAMGEGVTDGYTGNFDGNGHVIRNVTFATPTSAMAAGIFGTVQSGGTVKHFGVENLTFDNNSYDHRAGGIAGQLLAGSTISDCYVINSTVKASSRVVGGIVGMNKGTVRNCYTYNMTLAAANNRFGGISGDFTGGTLENCYTNYSALASSQTGTTTNCEAGISAERFASGEIAYKLNGSTSDGELVWYQTIDTDAYPQFTGSVVYYDSVNGYNNHIHNWTYTKDGNKITATCTADECTNKDGGSVTLVAEDAYYTGSAIAATVEGSFTSGATYVITYTDGTETAPSTVGTHTAILTVFENETEKASVSAEYKISYLTAPENAYSISGGYEDGDTYWFKDDAAITVKAPEGYTISTTLDGTYGESVSFSENDSKVVYLKKTSDGAMTNAITISETISFDADAPTGKITIESRGFWEKLINKITFGLFFKGDKVATVTTADADGSGVKSIQYYLADKDLVEDDTLADADAIAILETAIDGNWSDYNKEIALTKNAKYVIYVKITDNVGNVTYINSEGIVLYTDAEADTESVSTIYKAGEDKDVTVKLNGNTVKSVANGTITLTAGTDYSVSTEGVITLKATYLDTLNAGEYTFTVSYNPLGLEYTEATENDVPATTTFKVTVEQADGAVTNISAQGKTYDGKAVAEPTYTSLSTGKATFEYKLKGADDSTYTTAVPSDAGDYVVRVTVAADTNYKEASDTAEFTIDRAKLTNVSVKQNGTLTYNGEALTPIVSTNAVAVNNQPVTFTYSMLQDGTYGTLPSFDKAGSYTVYYKATAPNHNEVTDYFTVTVAKAIVTEPTIASKSYNGTEQKADISDTDLYTVVQNNGGTEKGSYDVVLKLKDSANYKWSTTDNEEVTLQFVISAAQNDWDTKPSISGWTYGETAKAPVGAAKYGTVKVVYSGKDNDGTDYNSETAPTKAGSYTATFTVEGTEDYSGLSEQVNFTIAKKAVTVTANDVSKTYGDSDPALTYTHTELVGSDVLNITVSRASGENANTYTITASQAEGANPNYDITFKTGTFTIGKAALTVTVEDKTATYGDAVPNYTVNYDGFVSGDDKDDLDGTLAFDCAYAQFDDKGEYTIKASGYTSGNYTITYVDGKLTVNAKPITVTIQNATGIYGDALAEMKATDNGIVNGDTNVYSLATVATSASNVGKYAITGTALDGNYDVTFVNGEYEITKREITITVDAKNAVVNTALPTYTYKVEGLVGEDKLVTEPTLTCNANIAVIGEYDITATGADAGGNYSIKYVPAKLSVLTDNAVDAAKGYEEEIKDLDPNTVTSEDKAELDEILEEINTLLDDENITDNGKKALEETKEKVEELIKEITDAEAATETENTEKVKDTTSENVTPENKTDLEGAKADLEKALEDNGGNYTDDEKKAIEDEIKRIDDALEVIGNVEEVEELIGNLPENITKDDEDAIKAADDAYNALSDYEKSLVDEDAKKALDDAKAALAELNKPADPNSPLTGDNSNMFLWIALLFISGGALITLTVVDRKRRMAK